MSQHVLTQSVDVRLEYVVQNWHFCQEGTGECLIWQLLSNFQNVQFSKVWSDFLVGQFDERGALSCVKDVLGTTKSRIWANPNMFFKWSNTILISLATEEKYWTKAGKSKTWFSYFSSELQYSCMILRLVAQNNYFFAFLTPNLLIIFARIKIIKIGWPHEHFMWASVQKRCCNTE